MSRHSRAWPARKARTFLSRSGPAWARPGEAFSPRGAEASRTAVRTTANPAIKKPFAFMLASSDHDRGHAPKRYMSPPGRSTLLDAGPRGVFPGPAGPCYQGRKPPLGRHKAVWYITVFNSGFGALRTAPR